MKKSIYKWSKISTVFLLFLSYFPTVSSQSDKVSRFYFNHITSCVINSQGDWQDCAEGYRDVEIKIDMNSNVIYLYDGSEWNQFTITSSTSDGESVYFESYWKKFNLNVTWQISSKLNCVYCTFTNKGKRVLVYSDR